MSLVARRGLVLVIVVGLGIDAYTHLDLADIYTGVTTSTVSQATLFRIEAVAAILAAMAVVVRPNRWTAGLVAAVTGGGAFALLLYRFVSVGKLGPLPDMSEPFWYTKKSLSLTGELIALLGSLGLLAYGARRRPVAA
ncbi:MAG: hypothetical protein QOG22_2763 [Pseudonocardiales bacterium]|jgi:hypothetical protein|nr:hypothetical protein [Pseudonocardiales bacterium]MDT4972620.1 hypothetical protein [Pseudonocardiales bacterium]